jgi:hypothetical protein
MPVQIGDSDISPKRLRITLRATRGTCSLALRRICDVYGRVAGLQPFLAPVGLCAMSEEAAIAWATRLIEAVKSTATNP